MQVVKHISPRAEQLIGEYDLGRVKAEYKESLLKPGLIASVFLLIGLVCLIFVFPIGGASPSGMALGVLLSIGGCFSLIGVIGISMVVVALRKGERYIYLGDKGFISARYQVGSVVHWEAVEKIHRQVQFSRNKANNVQSISVAQTYTIIPAEGKKTFFFNELGLAVERTATTYLLPRALEDYAAGKTLSFGWLALNSEGLYLNPEPVPVKNASIRTPQKLQGTGVGSSERFVSWENLACYWIDESTNTLILSRKHERKHWAILPLYQVPNSALCLAVIEHALAGDIKNID